MALCPGLPGWAGTRRYNQSRFTAVRDSQWQWHQLGHMQICTSPRQITTPASHHSVFTGWMPFLPPNQQHQDTEGKWLRTHTLVLRLSWILSGTTVVSRYQEGQTSLDLLEQEIVSSNGICWAICKSLALVFRQITMPSRHHSVFASRMLFVTPDWQCQSIEGSRGWWWQSDMIWLS